MNEWQQRAVEVIVRHMLAETPGLGRDDAEAFARYIVLGHPEGAAQ